MKIKTVTFFYFTFFDLFLIIYEKQLECNVWKHIHGGIVGRYYLQLFKPLILVEKLLGFLLVSTQQTLYKHTYFVMLSAF